MVHLCSHTLSDQMAVPDQIWLPRWNDTGNNLFCEKFKFRGFTKAFKNFAKYIIAFIFTKFKYFAKKITYLESPDHVLQNDI